MLSKGDLVYTELTLVLYDVWSQDGKLVDTLHVGEIGLVVEVSNTVWDHFSVSFQLVYVLTPRGLAGWTNSGLRKMC